MKTVNVKSLGECPYLISLEPEDLIGQGSYAEVRKAFNRDDHTERLAVKIFELSDLNKFGSALKQINIACNLPNHPNLLSYKKLKISSKHRVYIVMQRCEKSLKNFMKIKQGSFSQDQIWKFLYQFCEGYKIIYKSGIIHRDIKPDNILIGFDGHYKIADFGISELSSFTKNQQKVKGSILYLAPELLNSNPKFNSINDVYSLGVTVYEMCFKRLPYIKTSQAFQSISKFIQHTKTCDLRLPKNSIYSSSLLQLLKSMLQKQESKRCTWQYIFGVLLSKFSTHKFGQKGQFQQQKIRSRLYTRNFKIIEISDALLKNLSKLDTQLYQSLSNQSLVVIDHVQAEVIHKRQIVYFCDRLQYRIQVISAKKRVPYLQKFGYYLLKQTVRLAQNLDSQFQKYYAKVSKSQFLKVVTSQKYSFIRNLVREDHLSLKKQITEIQNSLENQNKDYEKDISGNQAETLLYSCCFQSVVNLYSLGYYEECRQVEELEKWLQLKQKSQGLLSKLRKNENALRQFDNQNRELTKQNIKYKLSSIYFHSLNKLDNQGIRSKQN